MPFMTKMRYNILFIASVHACTGMLFVALND